MRNNWLSRHVSCDAVCAHVIPSPVAYLMVEAGDSDDEGFEMIEWSTNKKWHKSHYTPVSLAEMGPTHIYH